MENLYNKEGQALMWNGVELEWRDISVYKIQQHRRNRKKKLNNINKKLNNDKI